MYDSEVAIGFNLFFVVNVYANIQYWWKTNFQVIWRMNLVQVWMFIGVN